MNNLIDLPECIIILLTDKQLKEIMTVTVIIGSVHAILSTGIQDIRILEEWRVKQATANLKYFEVINAVFKELVEKDPRLQFYGNFFADLITGKVTMKKIISGLKYEEERKEGVTLQ